MNERIQEYANAAEIHADGFGDRYTPIWFQFYNEKFSELIVRECADWIDRQDESRCPYWIDLIEHFGVEE